MLEEQNLKQNTLGKNTTVHVPPQAKYRWKIFFFKIFGLSAPCQSKTNENHALLEVFENTQHSTSINDWIKAAEVLAQCVITLREALHPMPGEILDIDSYSLGASTYLYQIDRLLVKVREHYLTFRLRQEQFSSRNDVVNRVDFMQARQACMQCYHSTMSLYTLLLKAPKSRVFCEELIANIHMLELQTATLCRTMRALNQIAYRHDESDLNQFEQDLIQTLLNNRSNHADNHPNGRFSHHLTPTALYCSIEQLRAKATETTDLQSKELVEKAIQAYELLKRCYVISRKAIINETLDEIGKDVEGLATEFLQSSPHQEKIIGYLQHIFQRIESLLFSTHRTDSHCSLNLFNKAKEARLGLRKACIKHPIGYEYIKHSGIKRTTLLKENVDVT